MKDFRLGYLYSLAPIHCGGEGDLGNILDIARESHTQFPYIPGSSLRGGIRNDLQDYVGDDITNRLFGKELGDDGTMGVHQVWFGDARLLWVPMRTMSKNGTDVFQWVSCPSLLRDHAILGRQSFPAFADKAYGDAPGDYLVAGAKVKVNPLSKEQKDSLQVFGAWSTNLGNTTAETWQKSRIVLPDSDFQVLLEHALWTQIRNKIQDSGGAEVFWTDICIPRDTILYYGWGYSLLPDGHQDRVKFDDHQKLIEVLTGLIQVGGQANVGRGWVQSWVANEVSPVLEGSPSLEQTQSELQKPAVAVES